MKGQVDGRRFLIQFWKRGVKLCEIVNNEGGS